jgi:hypothetical protein
MELIKSLKFFVVVEGSVLEQNRIRKIKCCTIKIIKIRVPAFQERPSKTELFYIHFLGGVFRVLVD